MFGIEEKLQEMILRERLEPLEDLFEDIKQEYFTMARDYDSAKARIEELEGKFPGQLADGKFFW